LAGLAGNKFLTKSLFEQFFKMKTYTYLLYDVFNWVTPGQSTTNCLQLFYNFYYDATKLLQTDLYHNNK